MDERSTLRRLLSRARAAARRRPSPDRPFELAFVILTSDEVHNHVRRQQLELLRRHGANPALRATPHITLKLGFPAVTLEPFERFLDELAADLAPFEIRLPGYGSFDEGILYLDVERTSPLEALRRRIVGELAARFGVRPLALEEGDRFHFHATLAYGLSRSDFERARGALRHTPLDFRFQVERLALLCHTGSEWVTYRRARVRPAGRDVREHR